MNASGLSSRYSLCNVIPAAHPERTDMAEALDRCEALLREDGAWRIHGGGFAGSVQCLVPVAQWESFRAAMTGFYGEGSVSELRLRSCGVTVLPEPALD